MKYISRHMENRILELSKSYSAILLTGPRQAGKTTMLRELAEKENIGRRYVTLDNLSERDLAKNDPALFLQLHKPPVLIDEVQYAPELFTYIKIHIDEHHKPGDFWMTGSQIFRLMRGVQESLAGRVALLHMSPMSQREIVGSPCVPFTTDMERLLDERDQIAPVTTPELFERLWRGSMPGLISGQTPDRNVFYSSYLSTYVERDVRVLSGSVDALKLDERYKAILRSKGRIQDWEDELQSISDQISGKENMRQYESELADIRVRLRDLHAKKDRLNRDDGAQKSDIERYKKIYDSLTAVSGKNRQAMELIAYAEAIREWLAETYKEKELTIREDLETKVNKIFERMYHGHRRVAIDAKYHVELLTTISDREIAAGESEGSNRVKNFAFIAGLVALAKGKIVTDNSENGINLSSEPYPLVMDAPFSNADETHTANISKVLPEIAEQVIMFVMQKDWNYAEPVMNDRVGQRYHLDKISETLTRLN